MRAGRTELVSTAFLGGINTWHHSIQPFAPIHHGRAYELLLWQCAAAQVQRAQPLPTGQPPGCPKSPSPDIVMAMLSLRTAAREMGGPPSATSRGIAGGGNLWYLQVALPVCENYGALSLRN